jgi:ATP-dependent helicase Lhr and Lhr-like helicase
MTALNAAVEYHAVNSLGWTDLRPLQRAAIDPVVSGADCLLLAPTAGGKTEAAFFPLLSRMADEDWHGLSVLYVTPLRALLNNLHPRLESYGAWLGRRVGLWHGDVGDGERRRMLADPPDVLLTTPESLESMLVSGRVDHRALFAQVRTVVVDELHAFAGDDRGWHLLAVLERIQRLAGRPMQRVGLSATVGNPEQMLTWLQGSSHGRPAQIVSEPPGDVPIRVTLDYVGSIDNAAQVIASLHAGEKRLVFCESRRHAEELAFALRQRAVTTYVSHSSLSADERRQSERAFAEARDCVIVATSTLELGVDIGDLDHVIQIDAPRTVASFLQRLGRTGRRPGTERNMLFLATEPPAFLRAAAICLLWRRGFVEAVTPPPSPRHIAAQQVLALALQERSIGASTWRQWWDSLTVMADADNVMDHLRAEGFLAADGDMLFIGPAAEREFGRRYFMDLLSSFTSAYELRVIAGTKLIGTVSPLAVAAARREEVQRILLAGHAWRVMSINWEQHEILVQEEPERAKVRWPSEPVPESFELCQAQRDILLGAIPDVILSRRAVDQLASVRELMEHTVSPDGLVLQHMSTQTRLWTWSGWRANETLIAGMAVDVDATSDNNVVHLPAATGPDAIRTARVDDALPAVPPAAVDGLKFSAALPLGLATQTLAERHVDRRGAAHIATAPLIVRSVDLPA